METPNTKTLYQQLTYIFRNYFISSGTFELLRSW